MAVSFGIVGGGWWAEVYLRIARELPERFRVSAMVLRREEAGAAIEAEWGVPTYRTVEELVEATPAAELEFLIVCIASSANAAMLKRVAALGVPALSQCAHRSPVSPCGPPLGERAGAAGLRPVAQPAALRRVLRSVQSNPLRPAALPPGPPRRLSRCVGSRTPPAQTVEDLEELHELTASGAKIQVAE
eukprot:COSAG04_NODE_4847_length_1864_cov_1.928612_1_plen_188_part_10